jgi:hypothetical protein
MTSLFRTLFFWGLAVTISVIAVANRKAVLLSFDPFNSVTPAISLQLPQFWIILGAGLAGIVLGGWSSWLSQAHLRQSLREAEERIRRLERELEGAQALIARPAPATALKVGRSRS